MGRKKILEKRKNKGIRKQRKELVVKKRLLYVTLKCIKCKQDVRIHINEGHQELFEKKRKENKFVCLICQL